jgi:2-polyprenyl-6-methoxyphenol hydroxylase-like FAD-dependent oxidoreductase
MGRVGMTVFDADVIVVGAGPAGLMLAAEVASAGLSCTVLERRSEETNAFPGRSVLKSIMLADVRLAQAPTDALTVEANAEGFVLVAPFGDGWYRSFAWNRRHQAPDTSPVDLAEVRDVTRRVLGTDYRMHDPRWMSRFHSDERQASHYRAGRVFLAGDAAHCH